jgi:hypothetical protein
LIGSFEGIDSERGSAWRTADSLALRRFLGLDGSFLLRQLCTVDRLLISIHISSPSARNGA